MVMNVLDNGVNGTVQNVYPLHKFVSGLDHMDVHGMALRKFGNYDDFAAKRQNRKRN